MIIKKYKSGWFIFLLLSSFVKWALLRTTKCWSCISRADSFFTHSVIGQLDMTLMIQKYVVQFQISIHNTYNEFKMYWKFNFLEKLVHKDKLEFVFKKQTHTTFKFIHGAETIFTILKTLLYTPFFKHKIFFKGTLLLQNFASFQNVYNFKTCDH